jgi:hypothetical protein
MLWIGGSLATQTANKALTFNAKRGLFFSPLREPDTVGADAKPDWREFRAQGK